MTIRYLKKSLRKSAFYPSMKQFIFDLNKFNARLRTRKMAKSYHRGEKILPSKLHFGCGERYVDGWLNVDMNKSDIDMDFTTATLPLKNKSMSVIVSQHVIEYLDLHQTLVPLLKEFKRILTSDGELWLSCPDIQKIATAYLEDNCLGLIKDRQERIPDWEYPNLPSSHMVNLLFYQGTDNRNLFDFQLLEHLLLNCGFSYVQKMCEDDLLSRFPDFPARFDDLQTLYIKAW